MDAEGGMVINTQQRDGATIVSPVGDIDLGRSPALRRELQSVQDSRPSRVVVDLGQVSYMDSSGVATLVEALQVARRSSTSLVVCSLNDRVRSIFEIARLDSVFTIAADVESALIA
jgi:anti-sigma B factor antagonist